MDCYKNLYILGTSHISVDSIKSVENFISKEKPEVVAIELDKKRFYALNYKSKNSFKDVFSVGFKPFLVNLIGAYIEKKLGKVVGVRPGSDMLKAIEMVKKYNLRLCLIDQDINLTLKKLSKEITFKVILKFVRELFGAVLFKQKKIAYFDIRKVPSRKVINLLLKKIKKDYPGVYRVLIEERNEVMAKNLYNLMTAYNNKKIFAVVGAGHGTEIINVLKRIET